MRFMKEMGLLLTPEIIESPEVPSEGPLSVPWLVAQKRCCFTELPPSELPQHTKDFGHFSIEFDIQVLRSLGAIPVFYLPRTSKTNAGAETLATEFIACIGNIGFLLDRLSQLEEDIQSSPNTDGRLVVKWGSSSYETRCLVEGAGDLFSYLTEGNQSVDSLRAALQALSGFFYPTEDLRYTGLLGYYRQREWRIIASMAKDGVELTRPLDAGEKKLLLELDPEFFGEQLPFRNGAHRRVDQCKLFELIDKKPIIRYARRVIVPKVAVTRAKGILNEPGEPRVVALDEAMVKCVKE